LTLAPALAPVVPAFLALLDVPVDKASWHALDPLQRRQQMLDAVKRLLLRESEVQTLVVVFEDLHWIDGETQNVLSPYGMPLALMVIRRRVRVRRVNRSAPPGIPVFLPFCLGDSPSSQTSPRELKAALCLCVDLPSA